VKPYLALAGLELGVRTPGHDPLDRRVFIPGQSRGYRDDRRAATAASTSRAIAQSVNTYFYSLARRLGIDRFAEFMGDSASAADRHRPRGRRLGVLPSREWKRARFNQPWFRARR
jgi:penicillin-binding protein 2